MNVACPVLDTPRLRLRIPNHEDAVGIASSADDPEVSRYVTWIRHRSLQDAEVFIQYAVGEVEKGRELHWVITNRASERVLGAAGLHLRGHRVQLGYWLGRPHWGQGFATEVASAVVEWALAQPNINRVWAVVATPNHASIRVLEKAGMSREGLLRQWAILPNLDNRPCVDCWCYAKVR